MKPQFEVVWKKENGRYTEYQLFWSRRAAILFLNSLILDQGVPDARLRRTRRSK